MMPTAGQHERDLKDELPSLWSAGGFTDGSKCQGDICKSFLTVNMIQGSDLVTEVPLKNKRRGKGQIFQKECFRSISPCLHISESTSVTF